jgi:hypothetical protein
MTIIDILHDGTVKPPLHREDLIVKLHNGNLQVGHYNRNLYLTDHINYITEPMNALDLKNELIRQINAKMPDLFSKRYVVHFICPKSISKKVQWNTDPATFNTVF